MVMYARSAEGGWSPPSVIFGLFVGSYARSELLVLPWVVDASGLRTRPFAASAFRYP